MLDARRLSLLHELATRGTISATAAALHLSAPAVSQQLAVLEREAGAALLERSGRTLVLTPAGALLVAHAQVILGNLAQAESDLAAFRTGATAGLGPVRIAAFPSAARAIVARLWSSDRELPARQLAEHEPEPAIAALLRREADVAVVHAYNLVPRDLPHCDSSALLDDPVLLAVHPDEQARRRARPGRALRLADFADASWLIPGPETSCHEMIRRACGAAGFVVRPTAVATDFSVLAALVAAGAGVALIPQLALPPGTGELCLHPLQPPITRTISVLTRAGESGRPDIAAVLAGLRRAADDYRSSM